MIEVALTGDRASERVGMSAHDHPLDRLSFTLPDWRTALKKRFKRHKKRDWVCLLLSAYSAFNFYSALTDGAMWFAGFQAILCVLWFMSAESRAVANRLAPYTLVVLAAQLIVVTVVGTLQIL